MNIIEAVHDKALFRPWFKDPATWTAWETYFRCLYGLPLDQGELDLFRACTGLEQPPAAAAHESFVIAGRRSGKSSAVAVLAAYTACSRDWRQYLAPGERGFIFIIANDKAQAQQIKRYVSGLFSLTPALRRMVEKEGAEEIQLANSISILVKTRDFRTLRGFSVVLAILEEVGLWRSEEGRVSNPDREILAAIRPALATFPESLLVGISTPYSKAGVLWDAFKAHFGKSDGPLVWRAESRQMNPTLSTRVIERQMRDDPVAARSEFYAEFREDLEGFLSPELVEAVTVPGRGDLPRIPGISYVAAIDPSGGRQDSFTLAIGHRNDAGKVVLDLLRERKSPFSPDDVVAEFADLVKGYGCFYVRSDRYAGAWVQESIQKHGLSLDYSDKPASVIYAELLPLVTNRTLELPDNKRLFAQLIGLERRVRPGGKDSITHAPGAHDDLANAAAMCAVQVGTGQDEPLEVWVIGGDDGTEERRTSDRFLEGHPDVAALCNTDFTVAFLARLQQPGAGMIAPIARELGVQDSTLRAFNDYCREYIERVRRSERERIRAEAEKMRAGALDNQPKI